MPSVRIGSVFGIPIKLGFSFLLVLPVLAYLIGVQVEVTVELLNGLLGSTIDPIPLTIGTLPWVLGITAALGLFAGVVVHELGHSLMARRYGVQTDSITLWFLGGLAQLEEFPDTWTHELAIAIAGPIVSAIVGGICYIAFIVAPPDLSAVRFVVGYLAVLNVILAGFNLLPGFPMDGGRVLRAVLSRRRSRLTATRIAASVGKGFAILLGLAGLLVGNLFWLAIAFFVYIGATSETRQVVMEAALEGITVGDIMTPVDDLHTVTPETPLSTLLDRMVTERHTGYPVVQDDMSQESGNALVGIVTLEDVQTADIDRRDELTVGDVMSTELQTVSTDTKAEDAVQTLRQEDIGRLIVTDEDGSLLGLVSRTDLMTVLEIVKTSRTGRARESVPGV